MSYVSFKTINSLEEFAFIAGNLYILEFNVFQENGSPLDLSGATIDWVLSPYGQPDYTVLHLTGTITGTNTFEIEIQNINTVSLSGKYMQQPIVTAFGGDIYRPAQGLIVIIPSIGLT